MPKLHIHKKRRKGNHAGRKNPAFGQMIKRICMTTLITEAELKAAQPSGEEKKTDDLGRVITNPNHLPEGTTVVDTLYGHQLYSDARLMNFIDEIAACCQEFDDYFWEDFGSSIADLRRDRKNRTWADDQTLLQFCYVAIAMELAHWSKPRTEWKELPGGMPFIKFDGPKRPKPNEVENAKTENQTHTG